MTNIQTIAKTNRRGALAAMAAAVLAASLLALAPAAKPAEAAFPGKNGKIAFASSRDGNSEIYTMSSDGSDQTRLTVNAASDFKPAVSPDGEKIAFASDRSGDEDIWVMNSDGTGQTLLTTNSASESLPSYW